MKIQIVADHGTSQSAWTKAPADVATIAERLGFVRVAAGRFRLGNFSFIRRVLRKLRLEHSFDRICWKLELICLRRMFGKTGGELLLQHPLPGAWTFDVRNTNDLQGLKRSGIKITVLVHDIGQLRGCSKEVGGGADHSFEEHLFSVADKLIVHNRCMLDWFKEKCPRICETVSLDIFDYLVDAEVEMCQTHLSNRVLVAGGFGPGKAKYIQELKTIKDLDWHLYGHDFNEQTMGSEKVRFFGKFVAGKPPVSDDASWGLVWDGDSIDECAGATGSYLRWNNPHKLSLYLAMGLPVIVWKNAAVADFVEKNQVGITVGALREIPDLLHEMSEIEYAVLLTNARRIAKCLRAGEFASRSLAATK